MKMMEINIKMMTEEAYATLQKNYKDVYKNIIDHPSDSVWLSSYIGFEPYETKKYTIDDFILEDSDNYSDVAVSNGITLYEHLHNLPRYILCNQRFWAWIEFEKAYKQSIHSIELKSDNIVKEWWLGGGARRALMLGVISRGYFMTEISIDEANNDPYEATRYINECPHGAELYRSIVYRNIGMLKNVSIAFIETVRDASIKYGELITKVELRNIMKDASKIGSVMLIDSMESSEIYNILIRKSDKRMLQLQNDSMAKN
jgi:hypothetical protein